MRRERRACARIRPHETRKAERASAGTAMSPSIQHEPTCRSQEQAQSQPRSQSEASTQPQTQTQPADEGRRANGCGENSDAVTEDDGGPAAAAAAEQQFYDYGCSLTRLACACACVVYVCTGVPPSGRGGSESTINKSRPKGQKTAHIRNSTSQPHPAAL
mgnify:CR=1 FL=1